MDNLIDYAVVVLYFALMIGAGYVGFRRARSAEDYLVAGRRLGPAMYLGTLSAVVLGGASTIGGVSLGYQYGISGMWLVFMLGLGIIALGVLLSARLSRLGIYTVAEMLEVRYGSSSRLISAIIVAAYDLMVAVTATIAIGTVFNVILGLPSSLAILLAGGIVVLYSVVGGMWSITLTDILQFLIMTVGIFFVLLPLAISRAGGFSGMREELPASYFDLTAIGWQTIFTYFLLFFFGIMIGQDIWQRVFTARDDGVARWGTLAAGVYCLLYGIAGALIGTAAKAILPNLQIADNAFAEVAKATLPPGLVGLVLAAALAAVMSTASATLLASSTILANDVYARFHGPRRPQQGCGEPPFHPGRGRDRARGLAACEGRRWRVDGGLRSPGRRRLRPRHRGVLLATGDGRRSSGLHSGRQHRGGGAHVHPGFARQRTHHLGPAGKLRRVRGGQPAHAPPLAGEEQGLGAAPRHARHPEADLSSWTRASKGSWT